MYCTNTFNILPYSLIHLLHIFWRYAVTNNNYIVFYRCGIGNIHEIIKKNTSIRNAIITLGLNEDAPGTLFLITW